MATALVTGAVGFIGSAVCRRLAEQGASIIPLDRAVQREGADEVESAIAGCDEVYHIGGTLGTTELLYTPLEAIDANVVSTVRLLEAVKRKAPHCRVFFPTKPNDWLNVYSITKAAAEQFCELYRSTFTLDVRAVRWLNIYGPGQKVGPVRKAIPLFICQALEDKPITIWGSGEQPVDLVYVDDLAELTVGYLKLTREAVPPHVLDTGLTHRLSVNELVNRVLDGTGSSSSVRHEPMRRGEDAERWVSPLPGPTIADLLPSTTGRSLEDGMAATIEYYRGIPAEERRKWIQYFEDRGW